MIDDIEARLRDALREHAAEAPPGATMLSAVAEESRRRGRRSRLVTLSAGAATLLTIGAVMPFVARGPEMVAAPPVPSVSVVASSPAGRLVPARVPGSLVFPFALPAKYGEPRIMLDGGRLTASQELPGGGSAELTVFDTEPAAPSAKGLATKVGGQPATLFEAEQVLIWQPAPGAWLTLSVEPAADLVPYAEQVGRGGHKAQAPFTFKLMPEGWTVDNITPAAVTFCPPGVTPSADFVDKIAVMLEEAPGTEPRSSDVRADEVQVGGVRGWLVDTGEGQQLQVPVEGDRSLLVQVGGAARLPVDDLLAFAAGIAVTPAAQVSRG
jgi:hypothetical protein